MIDADATAALLEAAHAAEDAYLADLEALVRIETPSGHLPGLERAAVWLADAFGAVGEVARADTPAGPVLDVRAPGRGPRVLILAHYDTVQPVGSWPELWREDGDRIYGPGTNDMKGGLLFALHALTLLGEDRRPEVRVLLTPDEEVRSEVSRPRIEEAARYVDAVLVLEAPTNDGDPKVARKGGGRYRLTVHGKAAHQGVEPEKGVNAVVEAAHQILALASIDDLQAGTRLGANVIHGGTVPNVVADRVDVDIDARAWTLAEGDRADRRLRALKPVLEGARLELTGGFERPPMEALPGSMALFERARRLGSSLGLELSPGRVGGASDGNFTAAMGVATLDGLGPVGFADHTREEHILRSEIPRRLALFAALLADLG
ncbi:MAG TPA: M20 family metallopeptidase [Trueperaceae bacterium]|nr:M20 family metallopeptidase [Trueperaceae bacterium]